MSHSKRNTSLAFFTAHEREQLKGSWGSQSAQLNRDSFLPFGSCALCLLPCKKPVACGGGPIPNESTDAPEERAKKKPRVSRYLQDQHCHIFCYECALANLLSQQQELKRLEKLRAAEAAEAEEAESRADAAASKRAVEDFERVQMGLEAKLGRAGAAQTRRVVGRENGKVLVEEEVDAARGDGPGAKRTKRKFELDEAELLRIARDDRSKARKALDDERAASKSHVPSFWLPSVTPSVDKRASTGTSAAPDKPTRPACPGSTPSTRHAFTRKSLVDVTFTSAAAASKNGTGSKTAGDGGAAPVCPACSRPLTNASKAVLAKPCGHVTCGPCADKFVVQPALDDDEEAADAAGASGASGGAQADVAGKGRLRCFVCSAELNPRSRAAEEDEGDDGAVEGKKAKRKDKDKEKDRDRGLVLICAEGTGFASGGKNVVKKAGTVFQC